MGLLPVGSVEVTTDAVPFVMVATPSEVAPLVKLTVPVAVEGRVAVKVTD